MLPLPLQVNLARLTNIALEWHSKRHRVYVVISDRTYAEEYGQSGDFLTRWRLLKEPW